jgi:hypothetical protein
VNKIRFWLNSVLGAQSYTGQLQAPSKERIREVCICSFQNLNQSVSSFYLYFFFIMQFRLATRHLLFSLICWVARATIATLFLRRTTNGIGFVRSTCFTLTLPTVKTRRSFQCTAAFSSSFLLNEPALLNYHCLLKIKMLFLKLFERSNFKVAIQKILR